MKTKNGSASRQGRELLLVFCIIAYCLLPTAYSFSQGNWTAKTPLPIPGRSAPVGFTIGAKGYLGTGMTATGSFLNDFWEYDPITNAWTQIANLSGSPRTDAVGFSIGNFGYVGTGRGSGGSYYNDFWRYDPVLNIWTQLTDMGGPPRENAVGFSVAGKGYIGTGLNGGGLLQDLWEYDTVSNTWMQKANYGGGDRRNIDRAVFVIGNKAYMGSGEGSGNTFYNDFWEYDPISNTWTQKTNFPGSPRIGATGFSIGSCGFLGLGKDNTNIYPADFWKYNPFTNSWSTVTAFPGFSRYDQPAFVINNRAYIGTGILQSAFPVNGLWEFTTVTGAIFNSSNIVCSGQSVTLSASGGNAYTWSNGSINNTIIVSPTITTTYSVTVSDTSTCGGSDIATVTVSVANTVTAVIACQDVCSGTNATLVASGGANYLWSNGAVTSSISVSPVTTITYSVVVRTGLCADTTDCTVNVFSTPVVTTDGITDVSCYGGSDGTASVTAAAGSPPYNYLWSSTGGASPVALGLNAGNHVITVTDANGCKQAQTITITEPTPALIVIPNAFSPNNDLENDKFCMQGDNYCIKELKITIYDRWGEKVYKSNDKNFCWDGTYYVGKTNSSVFVYYLEATMLDGKEIVKKGNISLIR